jgi:hypothetical protein
MHEFTIEEYRKFKRIVEDEFGLKWLTKKTKEATTQGKWGKHPIPKFWKTTKDTLEGFDHTGVLNVSKDLIAMSAFAHDLSKVRSLPNYETSIKTRLKSAEFFKVQQEVYVASRCVRSNCVTEFVPRSDISGVKTSDLKLLTQWGDIYIEVTKRDAYHSDVSGSGETWDNMWQQISQVQIETKANHEVFIFTMGAEIQTKDFAHILNIIKHNIINNDEDIWLSLDKSCGVLVRKLPPPPHEERMSAFLPAHMNPGFAFITIGEDNQGKKYSASYNRMTLISLHSHKINSVLNTFNTKRQRKQIPEESIGLIYLHLDMDQVEDYRVPIYLELVGALLQTKFTPRDNMRIGAIVLTTGPTFIETEVKGRPFITARRHLKEIRNPFGSLPGDFVIP